MSATPQSGTVAIRILAVDDHRSMLWGLRKLIESAAPALELVATAGTPDEALVAAALHRPDIVLLDLDLGDGCEPDLVARLQAAGARRVLILTGSRDEELQQLAIMSGARGIVHKSEPAEVILQAIAQVHAGAPWLNDAIVSRMLSTISERKARAREPHDVLTPAERRVMLEVVRHRSAPNKVVADALHISTHTLRNHLASIYDKLGLKRRLDLVLYALERRLDRTTAA